MANVAAAAASTHAVLFLNPSSPSGTMISGRGVVSAKAAAAASFPLRSLSNPTTGWIPSVPASRFTVGGQFSSRPSLFRSWAPVRSVPSSGFYVKAGASAEKKKVLVVNTNAGGHAIIGFYFAQQLLSSGHEVTVLTVGDESSDKMKKPPFNRFSELVAAGGKTVWGDPSDVGKIIGDEVFDVVLENNGKDLETVKPVVDWAKSSGVKQFLYISSAGIYKPEDEIPHVEGDLVKGDASHVSAEKYLSETFTRWSIFRPQYMIGSGNNKDCEEWFFDRIVRGRPVPIPGSGMQLTNIAHARDLAGMLCLAVDKPVESCCKIFNCVTDRAITFNGLAKLCALAAGSELKIVHFDPKAVGVDPRKAFPFRNMHFYAEPRAAKEALGWTATTDLAEDLKERFAEYIKIGRDKKHIEFEVDDKILKFVGAA